MITELISAVFSGDLNRIFSFFLVVLILSAFIFFLVYIIRHNKINLNLRDKQGKEIISLTHHHNENQKQESPPLTSSPPVSNNTLTNSSPIVPKNTQTPESQLQEIQNLIKNSQLTSDEIDLNDPRIQKYLAKANSKLEDSYTLMDYNSSKIIDKKSFVIAELRDTITQQKQIIQDLNKKLFKYQIYEDKEIINFHEVTDYLKDIFVTEIRHLILHSTDFHNPEITDMKKLTDDTLLDLLNKMGECVYDSYKSKIFRNKDSFRFVIMKRYKPFLAKELNIVLREMRLIDKKSKDDLSIRKTEINTKIIATSESYSSSIWKNLFRPKQSLKDEGKSNAALIRLLKECQHDLKVFQNKVWDFNLFFNLIYNLGLDMISSYEQIKNIAIKQQLYLAEQFFDSLILKINEYIKMKLISKYEKDNGIQNTLKDDFIEEDDENETINEPVEKSRKNTSNSIKKSLEKNIFDTNYDEIENPFANYKNVSTSKK